MIIQCWNCGTEEANSEASVCGFCGELLRPDEAQCARARDRVEYLIRELKRWKSVPDWWKREAEDNYRKRLSTLREGPAPLEQPGAQAPVPAPPPPLPRAARKPAYTADKGEAIQRLLDMHAGETPLQEVFPVSSESHGPSEADVAMQMLMGAFSEKKIRLLYALGGVLLLASGVGILGSNWEGWGRQAMALLLTFLPVLFFYLARQLKEKLPVSSRMFTVLGGAMLPVGLLFLNTFDAPAVFWNPLAFLIGWAVNRRQRDEPICIYLAGLCWALAGWTTGSGLLLGLTSFAGASLLFWKERDNLHWTRVAHALAGLGLLSAFTRGQLETGPATTLFLLAIVYFTTCALVLNTTRAMVGSTLICLLCAGWLGSLLDWPSATVGLAALLQGSLYIRRGPTGQALAIYLTGAVLLLFLGVPMFAHLLNHFEGISSSQLLTCALTGALGAAFYGASAYYYRRPLWLYGASFCSLYAYFTVLALMMRTQPSLYRPWLIALVLFWQVAVMLLRKRVPESYLRPWAWTAVGTALLLVPLNIVLQMAGADAFTPWIYLGTSAIIALSAVFERDPRGLYVSMVTAALAYGTWLPVLFGNSSQPNLGLGFTAFVAALALAGLGLRNTPYGKPILVSAAIAGWGFSTLQFFYLAIGYWNSATVALLFYGVGFALPKNRYTNLQAGLCLLTALGCIDHLGFLGVGAGLAASAVLIALALPGYAEAALLWVAAAAVLGPVALKMLPALIWLAASVRTQQKQLAYASSLLALPLLLTGLEGHNILLLALLCAGQMALAVRWNQANLLGLAWLGLKFVYISALPDFNWTLLLWIEWAVFYAVNRQLANPNLTIEALIGCNLLATSFWQGGVIAALNPWLVVAVLMLRARQSGRADVETVARMVVVWAAFSGAEVSHYWLVFSLEIFLWCYVELLLNRPKAMQTLGILAWIGCLTASDLNALCLTLALGAGAFGWLSTRQPNAIWGTFGLLYHAYVAILLTNGISTPEFYTVPLAGWFLLWGGRISDSSAFRQLGLISLLGPSLLLSLGSGEHALWAGSLALVTLVLGQLSHRANYMAWGGLAVLTEVAIQAVLFASNLPWHQWAVAGGLLLVSMAFLVERRRQDVANASRAFLQSLNSW